jgi:hypothetical protein
MPKTKTRVADLEAWQEFRIGGTWYKNLLPPLCRFYGQTGQMWCLNLKTWKEDSLMSRLGVDEVR